MQTIHFKTVDPVGQELLRAAAHKGFETVWERFEAQQPQDGFLRAGLECPFGCMQGPCRIDPFGRGAKQGVCGLGRDGMAAAALLRLCLNGVLEAGALEGVEADPAVAGAADKVGGPVSMADVAIASRMLCRPAATAAAMVRQAVRLGLFALGTGAQAGTGRVPYRVGYGLLAGQDAVIGVYGNAPAALLAEISAVGAEEGVTVVGLGSWMEAGNQVLPVVCTSVEVEPLIASGRISLIVAGPATPAGIVDVAAAAGVPIVGSADGMAATEIVELARKRAAAAPAGGFEFDNALQAEATGLRDADALAAELKGDSGKGLALLGGFDSPHQSAGWIPTEVAPALAGDGLRLAGWGDAAAWMVKSGVGTPPIVLDPRSAQLAALKAAGPKGLKGVCFVSLGAVRDVALAVGLAACGVRVCAATPIPVWGSKPVMEELERQFAELGGALKHFDKPASADQVLAWFREA